MVAVHICHPVCRTVSRYHRAYVVTLNIAGSHQLDMAQGDVISSLGIEVGMLGYFRPTHALFLVETE